MYNKNYNSDCKHCNKPFVYSQSDYKIICFSTLFIRVISLMTGKMLSCLARTMNFGIILCQFADIRTL